MISNGERVQDGRPRGSTESSSGSEQAGDGSSLPHEEIYGESNELSGACSLCCLRDLRIDSVRISSTRPTRTPLGTISLAVSEQTSQLIVSCVSPALRAGGSDSGAGALSHLASLEAQASNLCPPGAAALRSCKRLWVIESLQEQSSRARPKRRALRTCL